MKHLKLLITAVALLLVWWATRAYNTLPADYTPSTEQMQMLKDVNTYRIEKDLKPLEVNLVLMKVAQDYACKMYSSDFYSHWDEDGKTGPQQRAMVWWYKLTIWENIDNLGPPDMSLAKHLERWKNSAWHNQNMLRSIREVAWMWVCKWFAVQLFWIKFRWDDYPIPSTTAKWGTWLSIDDPIDYWYSPDYNFTATGVESSHPNTVVEKKTVPMIWKVTEKQFLINLNKLFAKYLGWRKLYIK